MQKKPFTKFSTHKSASKMGIEGTYFNIVKTIYDKSTATLFLMVKNQKHSLNIRNKTRVSTLTTTIQPSFGSPHYGNQSRKRNKRNSDPKRRSKTHCFADDMILYIENPKDSIRKLLELVSEFRKFA